MPAAATASDSVVGTPGINIIIIYEIMKLTASHRAKDRDSKETVKHQSVTRVKVLSIILCRSDKVKLILLGTKHHYTIIEIQQPKGSSGSETQHRLILVERHSKSTYRIAPFSLFF